MAAATKIVDFTGPGAFTVTASTAGLLQVSLTNLGGVIFQFEDSDGAQLSGPIILGDLQQFSTPFGTTAAPILATAASKGLKIRLLTGGRLTGLAVVNE